ncbi:hypothetical protein KMZ15_06810 [Mycoavidus sp. HKI]|uniref:hypothetical protein n=1 Tax=Mycoavidus sp. HKI TaxID=2840467 RepID=UPI001CC01DBD|nr:hypothetical protein [Mycoavidus sp. HKI]UAW63772.1 hypothetical protein KMZ15_06810 [Mycoavidus sp. HKI]
MKFMKLTSIIALQALTACGGGSDVEGTGTPSLATSTQRPHSEQQTQDVTEQMNSTPVASLYTEQQVDHVNGQDEQQVWNCYVNRVKHTVTQNVMDRFKDTTLLLTYPTNTTKQLASALAIGPDAGQQTNLRDVQDKQSLLEQQDTPLTPSKIYREPITPPDEGQPTKHTDIQYIQDFYPEPITPPGEGQQTKHTGNQHKWGGGESTGNQAVISTPPRTPSFSDQSYSLDIDSEEPQDLDQQQDSRIYTNNNITTINTDNAYDTKAPIERKISDNLDKATIIVTREQKPPQISVQELFYGESNHPNFQDAEILFLFDANNHIAAILGKDDENNWYGISNYFSEKIIKLQVDHKNWLGQNIVNKKETKIIYFTQSQLDRIEPITMDELTESLESLPAQADLSIMDAFDQLPSGSIFVEQSSTEDEAKWVRSFIENIFFSNNFLTNDRVDNLIKTVIQSRAKRQISDDTESFIKEALSSIKNCAPNDEYYKAMVNNRRTILYKSFDMIKKKDKNTLKINPIIYHEIVSFYGNPYLSYSPEKEGSFIEVASNNKIKRAITNDEDFVIINK